MYRVEGNTFVIKRIIELTEDRKLAGYQKGWLGGISEVEFEIINSGYTIRISTRYNRGDALAKIISNIESVMPGVKYHKKDIVKGGSVVKIEYEDYKSAMVNAQTLAGQSVKEDASKSPAASPLTFSSLKVSLKGNLESVASQHALDLEEQFFRGINLSRRFNTNLENEEELNQWLGNAERWLRERIENSSGQFNAWNKDSVKEILNAQLDVIYRHEKYLFYLVSFGEIKPILYIINIIMPGNFNIIYKFIHFHRLLVKIEKPLVP